MAMQPSPMGPGGQQQMMHPQQQPQQQMQGPPPPSMTDQSKDNISKAKLLVPQLKETLMEVMKMAANTINANNMIDSGSKAVDIDPSRFDKSLEKFFSICDKMEVHLKTSIECLNQGMSSQKYLPSPVTPIKLEGSLTYPQYINVVKNQIAFAKEIHEALRVDLVNSTM